jgi:hypothetical protein
MADGRWLVAGGKDSFIFCRCWAGQTGRLPLRKPCPTVRDERDPRELSAVGYAPRHQPLAMSLRSVDGCCLRR